MKKDVSNKVLIWAAVGSIAGLLLIFWILSLGPTAEEIAQEKAMVEREAEIEKLKSDRMKVALTLREEVLAKKWNHLFEKEVGSPSKITIDTKHDVSTSLGGVDLDGIAMIKGVKYDFDLSFKRKPKTLFKGKIDELVQDQFRISKWEKYVPSVPKSKGDMHGAWAYMQLFVEQKLKNPDGAKFVGYARDTVTHLGGGKYRVTAAVDATNSFGATVRTPFTGVIEDIGGKWKLHEFNM